MLSCVLFNSSDPMAYFFVPSSTPISRARITTPLAPPRHLSVSNNTNKEIAKLNYEINQLDKNYIILNKKHATLTWRIDTFFNRLPPQIKDQVAPVWDSLQQEKLPCKTPRPQPLDPRPVYEDDTLTNDTSSDPTMDPTFNPITISTTKSVLVPTPTRVDKPVATRGSIKQPRDNNYRRSERLAKKTKVTYSL